MNTAKKMLVVAVCLLLSEPVLAEFIPSSDGTEVTDSKTGLVWRRCSEGQVWKGNTCAGSASTFKHGSTLEHAKSQAGWRVPSVNELTSITDRNKNKPMVDAKAFPATPIAVYWSSSLADAPGSAWAVNFSDGLAYYVNRVSAYCVRLVR